MNLTAIPQGGAIGLSWDANSETDLASYNAKRSTTSGSGYATIGSTLADTTEYSDSTTSAGVTYYYVITAVDASDNESDNSNEQSAPLYPGDLTLDNRVDLLDFSELSSGWQNVYDMDNLLDIANDWLN